MVKRFLSGIFTHPASSSVHSLQDAQPAHPVITRKPLMLGQCIDCIPVNWTCSIVLCRVRIICFSTETESTYVGREVCVDCHEVESENLKAYSKKGGFVSEKQATHLKNAGCEVRHGPAGVHVDKEDGEDIEGDPSAQDCETCRNSKRTLAFDCNPMTLWGAH